MAIRLAKLWDTITHSNIQPSCNLAVPKKPYAAVVVDPITTHALSHYLEECHVEIGWEEFERLHPL
jgi:hypothetical protein